MRARTKKRVGLFVGLVLVIIVGGGGLYTLRKAQQTALAERWLAEGLAAHQDDDHETAVRLLSRSLHAADNDPAVLIAYAESLGEVPDPNGRNIGLAIRIARLAADEESGVGPAHEMLLDYYRRTARVTELEALSAEVLERDPDHTRAAALRAQALLRLSRDAEAYALAEALAEREPTDASAQALYFTIASEVEAANEAVTARARAIAGDPDAPASVRTIAARALLALGLVDEATSVVDRMLKSDAELSVDALRPAIRLADALVRYEPELEESTRSALDRGFAGPDASRVRALATERAWKRGDARRLSELAGLASSSLDESQVSELGVLLLSVRFGELPTSLELADLEQEIGRAAAVTGEDGEPTANALEASAWLSLADAVEQMRSGRLAGATERLEEIAESDGTLGEAATFYLAVLLAEVGEFESGAARFALLVNHPSWRQARFSLASLLHNSGRYADAAAVLASEPTIQRWPDGVRLLVEAAIARAYEPSAGRASDELADQLTNDYLRVFGDSDEGVALRGRALLATRDLAGAREAAETLASRDTAVGDAVFRFASELRDSFPELADRLEGRLASTGRGELRLGLDQAARLFNEGRDAEATALLDLLEPQLRSNQARARFAVTRAQLLERRDPDAGRAAFLAASERYPNDAFVHRSALSSEAVWLDPTAAGDVIDRLRTLTGPEGLNWRVFDARRRLITDTSQATASELLLQLTDIVRRDRGHALAFVLAAEATVRLGDRDGAIEYLTRAINVDPAVHGAYPRLVLLLQNSNRPSEAERVLREFVDVEVSDLALRRERGRLLQRQGMTALAIAEWQSVVDASGRGEDLIPLAVVLAESGDLERAELAIDAALRQLERPTAVERITAASLLALLSRDDDGLALLVGLPAAGEWGRREQVIGRYLLSVGRTDDARTYLERAVAANPGDPHAVIGLVGIQIASNDVQAARATTDAALTAAPDRPEFVGISRALAMPGGPASGLLIAASRTHAAIPVGEDAGIDAMGEIIASYLRGDTELAAFRERLGASLRQHAGGYPLWQLLRDAHLVAGDVVAASLAMREAARVLPGDARAAESAARLALQAGSAGAAVALAERWIELDPRSFVDAKLLLAESELRSGSPARALRTLNQLRGSDSLRDSDIGRLERLMFSALVTSGDVSAANETVVERGDSLDDDWGTIIAAHARLAAVREPAIARDWLMRADEGAMYPATQDDVTLGWFGLAEVTGEQADVERVLARTVNAGERPRAAALFAARGQSSRRLGDLAEAERAFRRAVDLGESATDLLNNLAYVIVLREGNGRDAMTFAQRAIDRGRVTGIGGERIREYYDTLRLAALLARDDAAAERAFREGLTIDPSAAHLKLGLAESLVRLSRATEAREVLATIEPMLLRGALRERFDAVTSRVDAEETR